MTWKKAVREPHLAEDGRRIAKLRDDATKTKQKSMDELAQAAFRTDAEREESGGVLPRAELMRVAVSRYTSISHVHRETRTTLRLIDETRLVIVVQGTEAP